MMTTMKVTVETRNRVNSHFNKFADTQDAIVNRALDALEEKEGKKP